MLVSNSSKENGEIFSRETSPGEVKFFKQNMQKPAPVTLWDYICVHSMGDTFEESRFALQLQNPLHDILYITAGSHLSGIISMLPYLWK